MTNLSPGESKIESRKPKAATSVDRSRFRLIHKILIGGTLLAIVLAGCAGAPDGAPRRAFDASNVPDAVPRVEPRSRYGNPDSYEVFGETYRVLDSSAGYVERGIASWYGTKFHGRRTSSGEDYDMYAMTAAHKTLPLPTYVRVTNLRNNHSVVVRVNDRGPFRENRIIDLSYAAALKLDIANTGTGLVEVAAIDPRNPNAAPAPPSGRDSIAGTRIFLQVGAFSDSRNAYRLLGQLLLAGYENARVLESAEPAAPLYRVRLGPLADVAAVDRLAGELNTRFALHDSHVIVEN